MYELDIPADADPARVYGTPEFERARRKRAHASLIPRRAVEPMEEMTAQEAMERFRAVHARMRPVRTPVVVLPPARWVGNPILEKLPEPADRDLKKPSGGTWTRKQLIERAAAKAKPLPLVVEKVQRSTERMPFCKAMLIDIVASYYKMTSQDICGARRHLNFIRARHVTMYLMHSVMKKSFPEIGNALGKDHTTAINGFKRVSDALARGDADISEEVGALTELMGAVK